MSFYIYTSTGFETLRQRLEQRKTEDKIALEKRLKKVKLEMSMSDQFDVKVINKKLDKAISDTKHEIKKFIIKDD